MKNSANTLPLLPGETPLPKAPAIVLDDGTNCIPQHYLSYQHTLESVAEIISSVDFDPQYVLFVDEDKGSIFIQVGIIGKDNYQNLAQQHAKKIVYGRRWRVEPQLPSSEIIQTAFLALTKAREHEIRELFKYTVNNQYKNKVKALHVTTPFSCHHDLPLIAMSKATNAEKQNTPLDLRRLKKVLERIKYDYASFHYEGIQTLDTQKSLLTVRIKAGKNTSLPELINQYSLKQRNGKSSATARGNVVHIILNETTEDGLMYGLIDYLIGLSNRYVEEYFRFKGFARFSRKQSISKISALSAKTRVEASTKTDAEFASAFTHANYETDITRVPKIMPGKLGDKLKNQLNKFDIKYGILPK